MSAIIRWGIALLVAFGGPACGMGTESVGAGGAPTNGGESNGGAAMGGALATGGASGGATAGADSCRPRDDADSLRVPVRLPIKLPKPGIEATGLNGMHRGFNLGNALDAPSEGAWGVVIQERHFDMAVEAGLDHVRVPVRFSAHAASEPPYTIDETFLQRVDWVLDQAESRGLSAVLDVHHYEELVADPEGQAERFIALWQQLAARYYARPPSLKYELANEPNGKLDDYWNYLYPKALKAVRAVDPVRTVIIDGAFWASPQSLDDLFLPDDPNLVATFHLYDPFPFTHQGASWQGPELRTRCVVFPGPPFEPLVPVEAAQKVNWIAEWFAGYNSAPPETNPGGAAVIEEAFAFVDRFIENSGRAVYLGEFGAVDTADPASRERWVRLVREHAEARGIPWAYWNDGGAMRAFDVKTGEWVPYLRRALLE
ncbi:MAG: glycoside hydrolase family 5 protein [Myxococcota bacterium]